MKATRRGLAAGMTAAGLLASSAIFRDFGIGVVFVVVLLLITAEAAWAGLATRKPESKFMLTRESTAKKKTAILYPGDEWGEKGSITKRIGGRAELEGRDGFFRLEPRMVLGIGTFPVALKFSSPYAGDYSVKEAGIRVTGPLGLFSSRTAIPVSQRFLVYPRVVQVAAATARLIGRTEVGGTPTEIPGVGSEYYEMRRYNPGDDARSINWKATARQGQLIVTEHMKETGGSFLLILDARAPTYTATDRLATTFLLLANSLASAGVPFGVLVHDGERVTASTQSQTPRESLEVALREALTFAKVERSAELLELVPLASRAFGAEKPIGDGASLLSLLSIRRDELQRTVRGEDPWRAIGRYLAVERPARIVYVSGVFGKVEQVIELGWQARRYGEAEFALANPCDCRGTEGTTGRGVPPVARSLRSAGMQYISGEPLTISGRALGT